MTLLGRGVTALTVALGVMLNHSMFVQFQISPLRLSLIQELISVRFHYHLQTSRDSSFIDAQGGQLNVSDIRVGKVQLGDVAFKERFIIADVTTPLLALGSIVRAGWSLHADGSQQYLTKDNKTIEVLFKRNSLCALGTISQIAEVESLDSCASPSAPQSPSSSNVVQVSAITLKPVLRFLRPGWNVLGPQLYAISTFAPRHVDSTTAPSSELMWVRTTVVKRRGVWELDEFAQPIADVPDLRAPLTWS